MEQRKKDRRFGVWYLLSILLLLGGFAVIVLAFFAAPSVHAAMTLPNKMNFQGRLTDASGNPLTGTYDMQLKLYDAASAGTLKWAETRTAANANAVTVTNGLFTVRLGEGTLIAPSTQLDAVIAANPTLYFEITVGADAPMTPRSQLVTSAYAFNSDTLDGLDSTAFGQLSGTNTWTSTNTFSALASSSSVTIGNATTVGSVVISDGAADGAQNTVTILSGNQTGNYTVSIPTNLAANDTVCLQTKGNCVAVATVTTMNVTLAPEYAGATFTPDGSNNTGSLSSDFCSGSALLNINASTSTSPCSSTTETMQEHNYYAWTTTQATAQDYDVYIRWQVPSDYNGSLGSFAIANKNTSASSNVSLTVFNGATQCSTATSSATTWTSLSLPALSGCTIAAGDVLTFRVRLTAGVANDIARSGEITFSYARKL